jgi:chaperonin GroES
MSKLTPLNGYLILKPIEETEQTYGNIVIPDLGKEKPEMGEVVATSGTYNYNSDKLVPSNLEVGDKVLIPKLGSLRITVEGDEYYIVKEQDVYSKIN